MKLLVLSDLHLELGTSLTLPPGLQYDAVVLAGDIHSPGRKAVHWAQRESTFGGKPVLLVAGNHEFYGCEMATELDEMRKAAHGSNVHLLERSVVVIDGVRFLGCMLWTDFRLPIRQPDGSMESDLGRALAEANRQMNDFRLIEVQAPAKRQYRERAFRRLLRAEDTLAMHWVDRDWLRRELAKPFNGPTVVVTHHAPSSGSVAERYAADWLTPAFVSDLQADFFEQATLWVHGHTHSPFEYQRRRCLVVSNPRGYRRADSSFENHRFEAGYIVDVTKVGARRLPIERRVRQKRGAKGLPVGSERPATESELADALSMSEQVEWEATLAERTDMVGVGHAAMLAGVTPEQVRRWALQHYPGVIAVKHPKLGLRFPRWQFEPSVWQVAHRVAAELQGGSTAALAWLETPIGAFQGRTPRAALEQGESADRVLAVAGYAE